MNKDLIPKNMHSEIIKEIQRDYPNLSKKLKIIARFIIDSPHKFALDSLGDISEKLEIPQSTLVRFSKRYGFHGALEFQKIFREEIITSGNYSDRLRIFQEKSDQVGYLENPFEVLKSFATKNIASLEELVEQIDPKLLEKAIDLIVEADDVYLVGVRRSYSVISNMFYGLSRIRKKCILVDNLAGMASQQIASINENSLIFAINYHPYGKETIDLLSQSIDSGAKNILLSDSSLHPFSEKVDLNIIIRDPQLLFARTLAASMCITQSIVFSVGVRLNRISEKNGKPELT